MGSRQIVCSQADADMKFPRATIAARLRLYSIREVCKIDLKIQVRAPRGTVHRQGEVVQ
jgi:hypothetical protein